MTAAKDAARKRYREKNRDAINEKARAKRTEKKSSGQSEHTLYLARMTPERLEEYKNSRAAYRKDNREKIRAKLRDYYQENGTYATWANLRGKAKRLGIPFNIEPSNIEPPEFCPALGIRLTRGRSSQQDGSSPSVDRLIPELGYVKGNVIVVSNRANRIKNDATPLELRQVADFYADVFSKIKEKM